MEVIGRFIVFVLGATLVYAVAKAVFGTNPTTAEIAVVLGAYFGGTFLEGLFFGERH